MEKYQHCHQFQSVQVLNKYLCICNLDNFLQKNLFFFHIVMISLQMSDIYIVVPLLLFILYLLAYQILNILLHIYYFTIAKAPLYCHRMKKRNVF